MKFRDWLQEKKFTLALSAGFFGFFSHAGFLAALTEEGILPAKITGASAGSIIAAFYASGHTVAQMKQVLFRLQRSDFWDPSLGPGLLKGKKFEALLRDNVEDDFSKLKTPVAISAFDVLSFRTKVFSGNASLIKAVRASSSLPLLFHPVLYQGSLLIDGGVADDWAFRSTTSTDRVLCHYLLKGSQPRFIEEKRIRDHQTAERKIFAIRDKISVGPAQLANGPLAFDQAYLKAKALLDSPV